MADFRISVDLSHLIPEGSAFTRDLFPTLSFAVQKIAEGAHAQWVDYAHGAPLPNGKAIANRTGEYARSILVRQVGDFTAEVFSELPYARVIEEGAPARDLKAILGHSLKVRLTKDGRRYLIIPFRHNAPGSVLGNSMPQAVWDWWKQPWTPSHITGRYMRPSGTGAYDIKTRERIMVPGWRYRWGERLKPRDLASMGITGPEAKRLAGMVNFRKPGGTGGSSHSKFITFRTMVEGSKGWLVPAQEGKWPARQTAERFQPIAEETFTRAIEQDVKRFLGG